MPIGVEEVEFAVVLAECRARIGAAVVGVGEVESLALADKQFVDGILQVVAIVGEIPQHVDAIGKRQDRHQVRRLHLRPDELDGRGLRAQLVGYRHGAHVEVQRQHAPILVANISGPLGCDLPPRDRRNLVCDRGWGGRRGRYRRSRRCLLHLLVFAKLTVCTTPSSVTIEVFGSQPSIGLPLLW